MTCRCDGEVDALLEVVIGFANKCLEAGGAGNEVAWLFSVGMVICVAVYCMFINDLSYFIDDFCKFCGMVDDCLVCKMRVVEVVDKG